MLMNHALFKNGKSWFALRGLAGRHFRMSGRSLLIRRCGHTLRPGNPSPSIRSPLLSLRSMLVGLRSFSDESGTNSIGNDPPESAVGEVARMSGGGPKLSPARRPQAHAMPPSSASVNQADASQGNSRRSHRPTYLDLFAEMPNILSSPSGAVHYVRLADNPVRVLSSVHEDYGFDPKLVNEWLSLSRGALQYCNRRLGTTNRMRRPPLVTSRTALKEGATAIVNPLAVLGYTGAYGDIMLKRIALGLAAELEADFVELSREDFIKICMLCREESASFAQREMARLLLTQEQDLCGATSTGATNGDASLGEFLRKRVQGRKQQQQVVSGNNLFDFVHRHRNQEDSMVMEYIEYCLRTMERASARRVIYLRAEPHSRGGKDMFRFNILNFLATRTVAPNNGGTFVILSEGCEIDGDVEGTCDVYNVEPPTLPAANGDLLHPYWPAARSFRMFHAREHEFGHFYNSRKIEGPPSLRRLEEEDEEDKDEEEDYYDESKWTLISAANEESLREHFDRRGDLPTILTSNNYVMSKNYRAPHLLITPPDRHGPGAVREAADLHKARIEADRRVSLFITNYNSLRMYLQAMVPSDSIYGHLLAHLPPGMRVSPVGPLEGQLADLMLLLPQLQDRFISRAEQVAICLALPSHRQAILEDASRGLTAALDQFLANRAMQAQAIRDSDRRAHQSNLLQQMAAARGLSSPGRLSGASSASSSSPASFMAAAAAAFPHLQHLRLEGLSKHERRLLPCIVTPAQVTTRFEDIGSLEGPKRLLHELISLRLEQPQFFLRGILRETVSGILLFGPPGTGKTMLAKAVAAQSGANFLAVSSASIMDLYVGEGEKNVRALFSLARRLSPCVIFIDEVDAILDSRQGHLNRVSRTEVINEFMSEWDGLLSSHNNEGVTIMAATNRPFALDDAVLRRLPRRILIDLPDEQARRGILQLLLKDDLLAPDVSLPTIAHRSPYYSGSDLKNLAMAAAMRALRRQRQGEKEDHQQKEAPSADQRQAVEISMADFEGALVDVPASISDQMPLLKELYQWDRQFGEGNGAAANRRRAGDSLGFSL